MAGAIGDGQGNESKYGLILDDSGRWQSSQLLSSSCPWYSSLILFVCAFVSIVQPMKCRWMRFGGDRVHSEATTTSNVKHITLSTSPHNTNPSQAQPPFDDGHLFPRCASQIKNSESVNGPVTLKPKMPTPWSICVPYAFPISRPQILLRSV